MPKYNRGRIISALIVQTDEHHPCCSNVLQALMQVLDTCPMACLCFLKLLLLGVYARPDHPSLWSAPTQVLAEKAAWAWQEETGISLVTIHPAFVIGPLLYACDAATAQFMKVSAVYCGIQEI